jgi:hypothetical protein
LLQLGFSSLSLHIIRMCAILIGVDEFLHTFLLRPVPLFPSQLHRLDGV